MCVFHFLLRACDCNCHCVCSDARYLQRPAADAHGGQTSRLWRIAEKGTLRMSALLCLQIIHLVHFASTYM